MATMFNIEPVLTECRAYIKAIDDYEIEVPGRKVESLHMQLVSKVSVKELLYEHLFEYEEAALKGSLTLMQLLKEYRDYYRGVQFATISQLNDKITRHEVEAERKKYEDQKERFFNFFHHNYTIIDLIMARLTQSPLSDYLEYMLNQVGLGWIKDGSLPPSQIEKLEKPRKPRPSTISNDKRRKELVENFQKLEAMNLTEAINAAAKKDGCDTQTIERALGMKKR